MMTKLPKQNKMESKANKHNETPVISTFVKL